jgi:excisionase family DNA binding protein
MGKSFEEGKGGGAAGTATELAVGFGIAQQMMQQGMMSGQTTASAAGAAVPPVVAPAADMLTPSDVAKALNVPEADVMAIITSGELKAKKIGTSYRITRAAFDAYLAQ